MLLLEELVVIFGTKKLPPNFKRRYNMSKVFREWFDTVDKNSQEWLDFVKQQEQDDEMSAQILEDMECKE